MTEQAHETASGDQDPLAPADSAKTLQDQAIESDELPDPSEWQDYGRVHESSADPLPDPTEWEDGRVEDGSEDG